MRGKVLLEVKDLKTYFFTYEGIVRAVDGVSFRINEGEFFGLVGETGCGKSVTALSVMRLIESPGRIVGGEILLEDVDLLKLSEEEMQGVRGTKISMVFQDPMASLNPLMRIGDQIAEVLEKSESALRGEELRKRMVELLRMVRMPSPEHMVDAYPFELSGGMRQRAMIAMMLAAKPRLLIADEPTTALDVTTQAQILRILKEMREKLRLSIWLITHDLGVVAETCDRVCVMYAGKIVECGTVREIFKNPLHPYTRGLLKAIPTIHRKVDKLMTIPGAVPNLIRPPEGCRFHPRCSYATDICAKFPPPLAWDCDTHFVYCHLYGKEDRISDGRSVA